MLRQAEKGAKLANIVQYLVDSWGWEYMYDEVDIKCFGFDPSVKSSLKFLRNKKFEWDSREKSSCGKYFHPAFSAKTHDLAKKLALRPPTQRREARRFPQ